jgi:hypothetical protein
LSRGCSSSYGEIGETKEVLGAYLCEEPIGYKKTIDTNENTLGKAKRQNSAYGGRGRK